MKKSIYLAVFLAWICAIAGGLLAIANYMTAPVIAANKAQQEAAQFAAIFGEGIQYESVELAEANSIQQVFKAGDAGYAYKVKVTGFQSDIVYIVGVAGDGKIIGYSVLEINDTPGFGMKVSEEAYINTVTSHNINDTIETISGASVSSKAVVAGLTEVKEHFNANFK